MAGGLPAFGLLGGSLHVWVGARVAGRLHPFGLLGAQAGASDVSPAFMPMGRNARVTIAVPQELDTECAAA